MVPYWRVDVAILVVKVANIMIKSSWFPARSLNSDIIVRTHLNSAASRHHTCSTFLSRHVSKVKEMSGVFMELALGLGVQKESRVTPTSTLRGDDLNVDIGPSGWKGYDF